MTTKAEVVTLVTDYLLQDDVSGRIDDLIELAEIRISQDLRVRQMQVTLASQAIPTTGKLDLEDDFIEISSHYIDSNTVPPLEYVPEAQFVELAASAVGGIPHTYTIVGDEIWFSPTPDSGTYPYVQTYYAKLTTILVGGYDSWVGKNIYLYAVLLEAEPYLVNDTRMGTWKGLYDAAIAGAMKVNGRGVHRPGGVQRAYNRGHRERRIMR